MLKFPKPSFTFHSKIFFTISADSLSMIIYDYFLGFLYIHKMEMPLQILRFFFLPFSAVLILIDVSFAYSSFIKFLNGINIVFVLFGFLKTVHTIIYRNKSYIKIMGIFALYNFQLLYSSFKSR